ncbi:tetratricopeptide repeat protein [Streptomyces sp. NPDC001178]
MVAQHGGWAAGQVLVEQLVLAAGLPQHGGGAVTLAPPLGERDPRYPLRGREVVVEALLGLCPGGGRGRLQVVHGLGGGGKTAAVLEVIHRHLERQTGPAAPVWWIDARDAAAVEAGLRVVARQAGLRARDIRAEDMADALWRRLAHLTAGWVLVLDGVDDPAWLDGPGRLISGTGWLRPHLAAGGLVIVTSRHGAPTVWGARAVMHPIRPLAPSDAARVLLDRTGPGAGEVGQARALAVRLGGLPLALHLCGTYLAEVSAMPAAYRTPQAPVDFAGLRRAVQDGHGPVEALRVVARTRQLALKMLERRGLAWAGRLLEVLASFADAPLPHTLLLRPEALAGAVAGLEALDGRQIWHTLTELAALGLLELDGPEPGRPGVPVVRLHPLIRDVSRRPADPVAALRLLHAAACREGMQVPEEPATWPAWQLLAPHALELAHHAHVGADVADAVRLAGTELAELGARYLQSQGMFDQACLHLEGVLAARRRLLGEDHPDTLSAHHNLAGALHDLGRLEPARTAYRHVHTTRSRLQGEEHPDTLTAAHELARVLHDMGDWAGARTLLEQVLDARHRGQGAQHAHTLAARHELARVLHHQGHHSQARHAYETLLALRLHTLGRLHPRTLTTRHNLACLLHDLGEVAAAHQELDATLTARTRILGPAHPHTLSTQDRLARLLHERGERQRARVLLQDAVDTARRTLGETHPDTRRMTHTLGAWGNPAP